jgi:molybdopterin molybdotransferase
MATTFDPARLLPPHEALRHYFAFAKLPAPSAEIASLDDAIGRVLSETIVAHENYPDTLRSTMDGFAVRAESTPGILTVVGESRIGTAPQRALGAGEAMRIPTGGVLPEGADAVVPIEETRNCEAGVRVDARVHPFASAIEPGSDMRAGDAVLERGRRIGAAAWTVLATLGITRVPVYSRPVVAVLSSGDELVPPGVQLKTGQVRDANRYGITATLEAIGASPKQYPIVRDRKGEMEAVLERALGECDGVVISGGSSVGEHDFTRRAIESLGGRVIVHGLRIRPGKPAIFAVAQGRPVVGLPGNPASALIVLDAIASEIVAALAGTKLSRAETPVTLAAPLQGRDGWTCYVPVALGDDGRATPLPVHSFSTSLCARATGYVRVGESHASYAQGESVVVRRFLSQG